MKISNRFTIAIHTLLVIEYFKDQYKTTSEFIAKSVQVNPVIIRGILGQLKKANLIITTPGSGGQRLARDPKDITLYDIFYAVEALDDDILFGFHENPNPLCPVGGNIHKLLDNKLYDIQEVMNNELKKTTLYDLVINIK